MATSKGQRIGIWIIAAALVIGTVGGFLAMMLAPQNASKDNEYRDKLMADYQAEYAKYQAEKSKKTAKFTENADKYSDKYYETLSLHADRVGTFDAAEVKELKTKDLKEGDGPKIEEGDSFAAYYVGWTPDGKIFDGSIEDGKLKAPFVVEPGSVIEGWTKGMLGMKIGGVRELTIPSSLAYGEQGSGESIPPSTPIKFIVMPIEKFTFSEAPQPSKELMRFYGQ